MNGYAQASSSLTATPIQPFSRVVLGFALAPMLPAFYATLFFAQPWAFPYGIALSYPAALLIGLPLYLALRRRNRLGWWQLGLVGMVCAIPAVLAYRHTGTPPHLEPFDWIGALCLEAWGAFTGLSFWLLSVAGTAPVTVRVLLGFGI